MAKPVNITLSDSLHERLQAVKGKLNISAMCQKTIERAVSMEEIKMKLLSTKEKVIERLRLERQKSKEDWFECGKTDGLKDAEDLSYDNFEQLYKLYESKHELEMNGLWIKLDQFPEDCHWLKEQMDEYSPKPIEESYLAGWVDGVTDFWVEIKDEI